MLSEQTGRKDHRETVLGGEAPPRRVRDVGSPATYRQLCDSRRNPTAPLIVLGPSIGHFSVGTIQLSRDLPAMSLGSFYQYNPILLIDTPRGGYLER